MRLDLRKVTGGLTACALALLAVLTFPDQLFDVLTAISTIDRATFKIYNDLALSVLFAIVLIIVPALLILHYILRFTTHARQLKLLAEATASPCVEADLEAVLAMAHAEFGGRAASESTTLRLFRHCPSAYWKVEHDHRIVGYFVLYSLTKAGERALIEDVYNGAAPALRYVRKSIRTGEAVHIAGVAGIGHRGRGLTLAALSTALRLNGYKRIYAKAISEQGLRVAQKFGFRRIDGDPNYEIDYYYVYYAGERK